MGELLFNPLLLNYGGDLTEYLATVDANDSAHTCVQSALTRTAKYLEDLKSTGRIHELRVSEHTVQIDRLRMHDQFRKAQKEAEKQSVFFNLVNRSVILYGRRSVMYVAGPGDERKQVDIEPKEFSTTVEFPRIDTIDPVGLDYMLRVFRAERLKPCD